MLHSETNQGEEKVESSEGEQREGKGGDGKTHEVCYITICTSSCLP